MSYISEHKRANPLGLGAAVAVNGSIILAVALSPIVAEHVSGPTIITGRNIPQDLAPPPPTDALQDAPRSQQIATRDADVVSRLPVDTGPDLTGISGEPIELTSGGSGGEDLSDIVREPPILPVAIFTGAARDPKFARAFQPQYPIAMLRQEIEGSVTVRILIGTDGRVRQVQTLQATDPEFARATERQARKAWRFKPAMRNGLAVEDWLTMTVRFDIN
ncbi:MAG: energy transducer TonB [Sphingorhabdus sp.]